MASPPGSEDDRRTGALRRALEAERRAREAAERRAAEAAAELLEAERLKTSFLAAVSHELRTPLMAIGGFVQLLLREWDRLDEAARLDFLRRVERNVASLNTQIAELLDFSRIERRVHRVDPEPVDLGEFLASFLRDSEPILGDRPVRATCPGRVVVAVDPTALRRILSNLLVNAVAYADDGPVRIDVSGRPGHVTVTVTDPGPGIPPEEVERIFVPFYRGAGDRVIATRGTGLGLTIARRLAELMGGSLRAVPVAGVGRFELTLAAAT